MKIEDIVIARKDDRNCRWNVCIGEIIKIDKGDYMNYGIIILDSKEPSVNPDGEYGLNWDDGIRWYSKNQLEVLNQSSE